jgi:N-methylhydantoinase B
MERLPSKAYGIKLAQHDVFVLGWAGASGCGDPLDRNLELIASDLPDGDVSRSWVEKIHGVVFSSDGGIDAGTSQTERAHLRKVKLIDLPERKQTAENRSRRRASGR